MLLTISFRSQLNWYWYWYSCPLMVFWSLNSKYKLRVPRPFVFYPYFFTPEHQFSHEAALITWSAKLKKMLPNSSRKGLPFAVHKLSHGVSTRKFSWNISGEKDSIKRVDSEWSQHLKVCVSWSCIGVGPNCGGDGWKSKGTIAHSTSRSLVAIPQNPGQNIIAVGYWQDHSMVNATV